MRRIRFVFVLLALVLLGSLGLVVDRAFDSLAAERDLRHEVVAGRIFDEMERELTAWLRSEEDRSFEEYRYFYRPESLPPQAVELQRSPLSRPPSDPFVVFYFQIDPDNSVSSPLWPDNEELARLASDWQPSPAVREFVDLVGEAIGEFWSAETLPDAGEISEAVVREARVPDTEPPPAKPAPKTKKLPPSEKSVLEQLNRGAASRRQRPTKVETSQAANVYNFSNRDNALQGVLQSQIEQLENDARAIDDLLEPGQEVRDDIYRKLEADFEDSIAVRLKPMAGSLATPQHLVLYRTVSIRDEKYRQGLVLDVEDLIRWLGDRVLTDGELATQAGVAPSALLRKVERAYSFRHEFEAPFAGVAANVSLDPLPEQRGLVNLSTLSLLLVLAVTFGLFALYRMVAVVVAYSERRNNFVSAVTHELKTPLTAIRMHGEMLRDGVVPDDNKRQRYYEIITAETERLTRLVQNVLELSRLEHKKRTVKLTIGDLVPVLEEVLTVLGPHAKSQDFRLRVNAADDLPQVSFDRDALTQVLFNLVDNALKYSRDAADKEIVLSCRREGDGVAIRVVDRGPGVGRAHLKKIFEPFYRAENELTRTSKGTGIGLALVRGLVEAMGGTVKGRNASDGGFEVEVLLAAA